jgi:single-strand DNA-binding protein
MRVACNGRVKDRNTGQWEDSPNYFDVTVFGSQGENCNRFLSKGRPVAVSGRLDWREWTTQDGQKRQAVQIIADSVQFLSDGQEHNGRSSGGGEPAAVPVSSGDFDTGTGADDDIPF